jgi:hypothetical protein
MDDPRFEGGRGALDVSYALLKGAVVVDKWAA